MHRPRIDLAALVRLQKQHRGAAGGTGDGRLVEVPEFGPNPGALRMLTHLPATLRPGAPLIVALHGCTQTAAGYDRGCGWSAMADRLGFALLLPEQRRANNPNLCFNWFEPGDAMRGAGEAASIRAGIAHMVAAHGLDPDRVFVTGLSAGGAMTAVMLATYPEVFAAGAVVAGLPYGAGWGVPEALRAMSQPGDLPPSARGDAVRRAGRHDGAWPPTSWPRVSIWHGDADATVQSGNAEASVRQWLDLHGLAGAAPVVLRRSAGHVVRRWHGTDGRIRVEDHRIAGMGHGVPLSPGAGEDCCGEAGAYMLDVGVSSTHGILAFWGLEDAPAEAPRPIRVPSAGVLVVNEAGEVFNGPRPDFATSQPEARPESRANEAPPKRPGGLDIAAIIEAAHRAAGLIGR